MVVKTKPRELELDDLASVPRWVAWREDKITAKDGTERPTKVPYDPNRPGAKARIPTDLTTCGTRSEAERCWQRMRAGNAVGGVGIVLGGLDDGSLLMGIDLDSCVDGDAAEPWAMEIVERFASYSEISPSGRGIKIFFRVAEEDVPTVKALLGSDPKTGKVKTRKSFEAGEHREIAIDRARFYAVTGNQIKGKPSTLRVATVEDVRWLLQEAGPRYLKQHGVHRDDGESRRGRDESGSGYGFRFLRDCKAQGMDYPAAQAAILGDQGEAGGWARRVDERQLQRAYDASASPEGAVVLGRDTPLNSARQFVQHLFHDAGMRTLVYYRGGFYAWRTTHYEECDDAHLRSQLYNFLDKAMAYSGRKLVPFNPDMNKVNKIVDALKAGVEQDAKPNAPFWLVDNGERSNPNQLIACRNGLLNIETRELLPPTPHFFNVNSLPFDYDPKAPIWPRQWMRFLRQLWPGDGDGKRARLCLQEIFGLMLAPDTRYQKIFLIVGPRRSGKGTIARVLTRLLGKDNVAGPTLSSLNTNFGLSPLIDKCAAIVSDARLGKDSHIVTERLLAISGEDSLTIDRKYQAAWTGRLGVRFFMLSNELPRINDASAALASRFVVQMLTQSFYGREDLQLTDKLLPELPGILNWALRGLERLRARGYFKMPNSSLNAIQQLEDLASPVKAFARDWCMIEREASTRVSMLYKAWKSWCELHGHRAGADHVFGRNLRAAFPEVTTFRVGGKQHYAGIDMSAEGKEEYAASMSRT